MAMATAQGTFEITMTPGPAEVGGGARGRGTLAGITGTLHLTVEDDGTHRYELDYDI